MILTPEILEQGKSVRGGWCLNQFRALGVELWGGIDAAGVFHQCGPRAGWKKTVLGKDFPESDITEFLSHRSDKKPRKEKTLKKTRVIQNLVIHCDAPVKRRAPFVTRVTEPKRQERKNSYVMGDEFLQSYEWRKLRMVALTKYGARCQCCGASPANGAVMNVDHIKPRRIYPELALDIENLQVLCGECNHGKGNWDMTDWRNAHAD